LLDRRWLLEQEARRRGLCREGEATVRINSDHRRDRSALFDLLRRGVQRLADLHDVHSALTEGRTDWRRGVGGAGRHLQLDIAGDLLSHFTLVSSLAVQTTRALACLPQDSSSAGRR